MLHHLGPHRIEFDIPVTGKQIALTFDQCCFVTPFPQCSRAFLHVVEILNITSSQRLKRLADAASPLRGHQQMHMICHQHIGMYGASMLLRRLVQTFDKEMVILFINKNNTAIIAAQYYVLGLPREIISGESRHGRYL